MNTCHNTNIIVQTTVRDASSLNVKSEFPNKKLANIKGAFLLISSNKKNLGVFPISIPYGYTIKLVICYVVVFLTSYGMEQDLHTNTSKYGMCEST